MNHNPRETALFVLGACRRDRAWTDGSLKKALSRDLMDSRDSALATRLVYGTMQNIFLCDFYISNYLDVRLKKLEPQVMDILRLGVYQILFMDKIPQSAAVDEAVKMAKRHSNPGAARLVNAVLRKISDFKDDLPKIPDRDIGEYLSIKYSHPVWIVKEYIQMFGEQQAEQLLAFNNTAPPTVVQINTLTSNTSEIVSKLESTGVSVKKNVIVDDCLELSGTGNIESLKIYETGKITVQDTASRLAVMAGEPEPGQYIIDACAAPGGKSFTAAMMMKNKGRILSCDIHEHKLSLIEKGAQRLNIGIIETKNANARVFDQNLSESADIVYADVPCSGLGIIRKKPDIRFKDPEALKNLPEIQLSILKNISKYVKKDGVLLYSTCTLLKNENKDVILKFLDENSEYSLESFELPDPVGQIDNGMVTLLPHVHGTDGFFIAKLRKKG